MDGDLLLEGDSVRRKTAVQEGDSLFLEGYPLLDVAHSHHCALYLLLLMNDTTHGKVFYLVCCTGVFAFLKDPRINTSIAFLRTLMCKFRRLLSSIRAFNSVHY